MEPGTGKDLRDTIAFLVRENMELRKEVTEMKTQLRNGGVSRRNMNHGSVMHQLADEITAIVGLREAITSRNRFIKSIWIALVLFGIGATVYDMYEIGTEYLSYPTATRVQFEKRPNYDYPAFAFCSDNWMDVDKVLSRGLSADALSYSLGYYNDFDVLSVQDVSRAREEFFDYYRSNGFNCLLDYYRHIATDPLVVESVSAFPNKSSSFYFCNSCVSRTVRKEFVDYGMCYVNTPVSAFPRTSGFSNTRLIAAVLENRTKNLVQGSYRWSVHSCNSFSFLSPQCRSVTIEASFYSFIRVSVSEYTSIPPCLEKKPEENYSPERCWARCRNDYYRKTVGCEMFWLASAKKPRGPEEFCNYFDQLPTNRSLKEVIREANEAPRDLIEHILNDTSCYSRCAYPCKRTTYQLSLESKSSLIDQDMWDLGRYAARYPNTSVVIVRLIHSAAYDGGIAVWTELHTFSWSQFIGSIGGTLGLFVGGTVLTLAQMILFWVNYLIDRRESIQKV